ncbi:MAG: phage major capsid protein [Acidaminococcaceae bacterium]|nr:phage major capsid protein [Acidaminococcaceae bacterium]MBQ9634586.1 phage major capsid protein [Acidaminococcaceae bacterium]MBQ9634644.1 phage major capsid protein [Acidaminococcaceae bacterium]MBQ9698049.1 phage major capsid protein [Acidaminococcaceae bacterium]
MDKKQYEKERTELLAQMKAAIEAGNAAEAEELNKKVTALDDKFQRLATAAANLAALNGTQVAAVPAVPAVLNSAGVPGVAEPKADEEKLYINAFAHYMMGAKLSADEEKIFAAKNATTTAKENYVVIPATMKQGIWHEMEERHPIIADVVRTNIHGDVDILVETSVGNDAAWYEEDAVTAEKATNAKITLKGCELAKAISVSWKLKKMAVEEFIAYIQTRIADKMGNALAAGLVTGAGVDSDTESPDPTEPVGVVTKLEAETNTPQVRSYTAANGITYADLTAIRGLIRSGYAGKAKFYAKAATIWNGLANVLDGNDRPVFVPDITGGGVGRIFGIVVVEEDAIPANAVLLGNMADGYAMNVNEDVTMYQEDHVLTRTTDYMGYALVDGQPLTTKAFAYLKKSS